MRRARFAAPDEIARTVRVTIGAEPENRYRARVEFTDVDGRKVSREVVGENCDEAADGIALITALAVDARAKAAETGAVPPRTKPGSRPATEPQSTEPQRRAPKRRAAEAVWHFDAGLELFATSAAAPEALFGIAGFAGAGLGSTGPSFRLMVAHAPSSRVELGAERAQFQLTFGRAEACPFSVALSDRFAVEPCAAMDVGQLVGKGQRSAVITEPETANVLWLCPTALGRLRLNLGEVLLFEVEAEIGAPLKQQKFFLKEAQVYEIPAVRFGAAFGVGFRFQ